MIGRRISPRSPLFISLETLVRAVHVLARLMETSGQRPQTPMSRFHVVGGEWRESVCIRVSLDREIRYGHRIVNRTVGVFPSQFFVPSSRSMTSQPCALLRWRGAVTIPVAGTHCSPVAFGGGCRNCDRSCNDRQKSTCSGELRRALRTASWLSRELKRLRISVEFLATSEDRDRTVRLRFAEPQDAGSPVATASS